MLDTGGKRQFILIKGPDVKPFVEQIGPEGEYFQAFTKIEGIFPLYIEFKVRGNGKLFSASLENSRRNNGPIMEGDPGRNHRIQILERLLKLGTPE